MNDWVSQDLYKFAEIHKRCRHHFARLTLHLNIYSEKSTVLKFFGSSHGMPQVDWYFSYQYPRSTLLFTYLVGGHGIPH